MQLSSTQMQAGLKRKHTDDQHDTVGDLCTGQSSPSKRFQGGAAYKKRLLQQYMKDQRQLELQKAMIPTLPELPTLLQTPEATSAQIDALATDHQLSYEVDSMHVDIPAADTHTTPAGPSTPGASRAEGCFKAQLQPSTAIGADPAGLTLTATATAAAAAAAAAATAVAAPSSPAPMSPARRRQLWAQQYRQENSVVITIAQQQQQQQQQAAFTAAVPEPSTEPTATAAEPIVPVATEPAAAPAAAAAGYAVTVTPTSTDSKFSNDDNSLLLIEFVESPGPEAEYTDEQVLQELLDTCCSRYMPVPIMEVPLDY